MDYLAIRSMSEPALSHARHFYLAQWYQDNVDAGRVSNNLSKRKKEKNSQKKYGMLFLYSLFSPQFMTINIRSKNPVLYL